MRVRIATGDVCLIELQRRIPYVFWHFLSLRQLLQQIRHRVAPDYRPHSLKERLDRFFGGLLRGETGPIIKCPLDIAAGMLQVSSGLIHPVLHCVPCLRPSAAPTPDNLMTLGIVRPWLGCSQGVRSARPRRLWCASPLRDVPKFLSRLPVPAPPQLGVARRSCPWRGTVRWLRTVQHGPAPAGRSWRTAHPG